MRLEGLTMISPITVLMQSARRVASVNVTHPGRKVNWISMSVLS